MANPPSGKLDCPDLLLIVGSDASGKNYAANMAADLMEGAGYRVEKREGWFSRKASDAVTSEDKTGLDLLTEKLFLSTVPLTRYAMSTILSLLIRWDLRRFRKIKKKTIIVSHTPVRVLAFYLGHIFKKAEEIVLPVHLEISLKAIRPATGVKTIVLDIDDEVRKRRLDKRRKKGRIDQFDRYMEKDGVLSERIEDIMIWLASRYLGAVKMENNDSDEKHLKKQILSAFSALGSRSPS